MATLREEAQAYEPKSIKNIADLDKVSLDLNLETRTGNDKDGKEFTYKVALIDGIEYRVPWTVLSDIKTITASKPGVKFVRVVKKGSGMNTDYTVIPID